MRNTNDLVRAIKIIALDAVEAGKPCGVFYGTVSKINPVEVTIEPKIILKEKQLIIGKIITKNGPLEKGYKLLLMREQAGQRYAVIDILEGEQNEKEKEKPEKPCSRIFGTITKEDPLEITLDEKLPSKKTEENKKNEKDENDEKTVLVKKQLILCKSVIQKNKEEKKDSGGGGGGGSGAGESGDEKILKEGARVLLLKEIGNDEKIVVVDVLEN